MAFHDPRQVPLVQFTAWEPPKFVFADKRMVVLDKVWLRSAVNVPTTSSKVNEPVVGGTVGLWAVLPRALAKLVALNVTEVVLKAVRVQPAGAAVADEKTVLVHGVGLHAVVESWN
jgi:hypothetical protein